MKRRALAIDRRTEAESTDSSRDTIPDDGIAVFPPEERDTSRTQVDTVLDQTANWYREIVIKKKLPPETVAFRIKLFNLIKNDFLKTAFEEMQKNGTIYRNKLANKYRKNAIIYVGMLRYSQYEQLIGPALADRLTEIFSNGNWDNVDGLAVMLLQLRPLLTTSFEED